jgi:hypothetical protein
MTLMEVADGGAPHAHRRWRQEVKPMRHYRWAIVSVPFVALALLVGALSVMLAMPR